VDILFVLIDDGGCAGADWIGLLYEDRDHADDSTFRVEWDLWENIVETDPDCNVNYSFT
jgi:hypothetical protein